MTHGGKTCWKAIRVRGPEGAARSDREELHGSERLVALYRFQNGEAATDHGCFTSGEVAVTDPREVDWDSFPLVAALEAVTHHELCVLRSLLRSPCTFEEEGSAPEPRILDDAMWALGLDGGARSGI